MKLFEQNGKIICSGFKKLLSIFIVFLLVNGAGVMPVAANSGESLTEAIDADIPTANELVDIKINGLSVPGFAHDTYSYTMDIPYVYNEQKYTIEPEDIAVVPYPADETAECLVDIPDDAVDGGEVAITVTDSFGNENVYTIVLNVVGENLYTDGGLEKGELRFENSSSTPNAIKFSTIENNPSSGGKALRIEPNEGKKYGLWIMKNKGGIQPSLEGGKTYLLSTNIRLDTTGNTAIQEKTFTGFLDGFPSGSQRKYYLDGSTSANYRVTLTDEWKNSIALVTPASDYNMQWSFFHYNWGAGNPQHPAAMDEFYAGELTVSDMKLLGETIFEISEKEALSYPLELSLSNQFGSGIGLDEVEISWDIMGESLGAVIEDGCLVVASDCERQKIKLRSTITLGDCTYANTYDVELIPEDEIEVYPNELLNIKINGLNVPMFTSKKSAYSMCIPYIYNSTESTVTGDNINVDVTMADETSSCDIDIPEGDVEGKSITITVTSEDGKSKTYSIALTTVGNNLYKDGGFENGTASLSGDVVASRIEDNPHSGNYAMHAEPKAGYAYASWKISSQPTIKAGKTYIASAYVRLDKESATAYTYGSMLDGSFAGNRRNYVNGVQAENTKVTVNHNWQNVSMLLVPEKDYTMYWYFVNPQWAGDPQTPLALDDYYVGELVVGSITYAGDEELIIPENGEAEYTLKAGLLNQFGNECGLENAEIVWSLADEYDNVSVNGDKLIVSDRCVKQCIRIRATVNICDEYSFENCFDIEVVPESVSPEIPKAKDVLITGMVEEDEVLTATYNYYNALGIDEDMSKSVYRWLYSDTMSGTKYVIPNEESLTYVVDKEYEDKYIFFEVTPCSVDDVTGTKAISNYLVRPIAPVADSIVITGGGYVDADVKATYRFIDQNGDTDTGSTYRWLRSDSLNGTYEPIGGAESLTYKVTNDDINKYIRFEVTPVTDVVPYTGKPVQSEGVLLAATPVVTDVEIVKVDSTSYRLSYNYEHPLDIGEGKSLIHWMADGVNAGTDTAIVPNANVRTITATITPVASRPPYNGEAVTVSYTIENKGNTIEKRPSYGGGGGGALIVPAPEIKPEPVVPEVEVPKKHWADDGISFVKSKGIMQEVAPGDFGNARLVNRSEFVYCIMKAIGATETVYKHEFSDVSGMDYYSGMLQAAVDMGIISKNNVFNPNEMVTREQMSKILVKACGLDAQTVPVLDKFFDKDVISEWARGYVGAAADTGLLNGVSENEFMPFGQVTREQTAVICKRLFDYKNGGVIK